MAWTFDTAHSHVGFSLRHMGLSTVRGHFGDVTLENVVFDPSDPTTARGTVRIAVDSITTGQEQRDAHLKNADFFEAESWPAITFAVTRVDRRGDDYAVTGDLTVRDVTRPVQLTGEYHGDAQDAYGNHKAGFSLAGTISRADYGLKFNVPLDGGGFVVGDKVKFEVDVQLLEQALAAVA